MVLFVTPALRRWAYDYFWLCVGAYSSDWSSATAGTSARLILTHDPGIRQQSLNGLASGRSLIKLTSW